MRQTHRGLAVAMAMLFVAMSFSALVPSGTAQVANCGKIDIMFVVDRHGGLDSPHGDTLIAALKTWTESFPALYWTGVRGFDRSILDKTLSPDHLATSQALDAVGGTAVNPSEWLPGALERSGMVDHVGSGRSDAKRLIIVASDGDQPPAEDVAHMIKYGIGIPIFSFGLGPTDPVSKKHMVSIGGAPTAKWYQYVDDDADVNKGLTRLRELVTDCALELTAGVYASGCAPYVGAKAYYSLRHPDLIVPALVRWDWGDGSVDSFEYGGLPLNRHVYQEPGTYEFNLTIVDKQGIEYYHKSKVTIPACPPSPPVASFSCMGIRGAEPVISFTEGSTSKYFNITNWYWELGDGQSLSQQDPGHIEYDAHGKYNVTLTVTDGGNQTASLTRTCSTMLNEPPSVFVPDIVVYEGDYARAKVKTTDPENDPLTISSDYGATGTPLGPGAHIDLQEFTWPTGLGDRGVYGPIQVFVDDGQWQSNDTFFVHVLPDELRRYQDADHDGIRDSADNCPAIPNRDQLDRDADGIGDACVELVYIINTRDSTPTGGDSDGDGIVDDADNCPTTYNPKQADSDRDGFGDACDNDRDGDGIVDEKHLGFFDNCPDIPNPAQADYDYDGIGDLCDSTPGFENLPRPIAQSASHNFAAQGEAVSESAITAIFMVVLAAIMTIGLLIIAKRRV